MNGGAEAGMGALPARRPKAESAEPAFLAGGSGGAGRADGRAPREMRGRRVEAVSTRPVAMGTGAVRSRVVRSSREAEGIWRVRRS